MSTQKQCDANRGNAQHSTGPRTSAGKSTASRNAFKHGFWAADATLYDDPETSQQISDRVTRYFDRMSRYESRLRVRYEKAISVWTRSSPVAPSKRHPSPPHRPILPLCETNPIST